MLNVKKTLFVQAVEWCGTKKAAAKNAVQNLAAQIVSLTLVCLLNALTILFGHVSQTTAEGATQNGMMKKEITRFATTKFPSTIFLLAQLCYVKYLQKSAKLAVD